MVGSNLSHLSNLQVPKLWRTRQARLFYKHMQVEIPLQYQSFVYGSITG